MPPKSPPVALTVAGSDNSGGAGIQADLKTFTAHGVYGLTAVTCVVAEVPGNVAAIQAVSPEIVRRQIELSLDAFPVAAMKTGMLWSCEIVDVLVELKRRLPPLVVDPVMVASSGDALLEPDALAAYRERLFPLATLVTPNLDEARVLLDRSIRNVGEMQAGGVELSARYGVAFLMKGGHLDSDEAVDLLCFPDGETVEYRAPFTRGVSTHGTGCTYSAAVAAGLAQGLELRAAVTQAKQYVTAAIENFFRWQHGGKVLDAMNHQAFCQPERSVTESKDLPARGSEKPKQNQRFF